MSETDACYFCGAEIREGDRIGGWVSFSYRSFPYCLHCAAGLGVSKS